MPPSLWRRCLALAADYALAYALGWCLLFPLNLSAPQSVLTAAFKPQQTLTFLILIIASALCHQSWRTSPGKWLLDLRIFGQGCPICREIRRLGPLLLLSLLNLTSPLSLALGAPAHLFQSLTIAALIPVTLYYSLPLLRRAHLMPWDRATGFHVTRSLPAG